MSKKRPEHPSVKFRDRAAAGLAGPPLTLDAKELKNRASQPELTTSDLSVAINRNWRGEREDILLFEPGKRSVFKLD
jgi:hypothetical protein